MSNIVSSFFYIVKIKNSFSNYSNKEKVVVIELIIFAEGEIKIKYMF